MNFRDYKWFNNPRGLCNDGPYTPLSPDRYTGPRMGWAKLAVGGSEHLDVVPRLLARGCMPIVQIYRERMGAAPPDQAWYGIYQQYFAAGVLWFELYDEPNAEHFWPLGKGGQPDPAPDWNDRARCIAPMMDHWLDWAERIAEMGAYPAFPAMAETTVPEQATVHWLEACLRYLAEERAARFTRLVGSGLWCAVHPYVLNHFYQEPPGGPPTSARPYYQQHHKEGGWHFEYPYDPLQQHYDPGRTPFGGTAQAPHGDPNGLVACAQMFTERLKEIFSAGPVPVVGTAGGIHPIPAQGAEPVQIDTRYYGYSRESHAEATLAMFRWMAQQGPPWFFGLTLSSEADYYSEGSAVPAIELMLGEPPLLKEVPNIDIAAGVVSRPTAPVPTAPRPQPHPEEEMPHTVLWPAPQGREEVIAPPATMAEPKAGLPPEPIPMPAPSAPEQAAAEAPRSQPPPEEEMPPRTVLWPAPQGREEVAAPPGREAAPVAPVPPATEPAVTVTTMDLPPHPPAAKLGPGPGPVSGIASDHWLMPAPDLPPDWLMAAARRYWEAFRTPIVADPALIGALPPEKSLAITVLAPHSGAEATRQHLVTEWPNVQIDLVAADSRDALQAELDRRARQRQEYG